MFYTGELRPNDGQGDAPDGPHVRGTTTLGDEAVKKDPKRWI
jgi:hypothetical protein